MRARNIKPGFFLNCELSEADFASRLLFIGLWCYADRDGRFAWKPKQIKASIFPYDNVDIDKLLKSLLSLHFITCIDGIGYVEHFKKHQNPHPHEAKSILPEKPQQNQCHDMSVTLQEMSVECNADIMIKDTMIPDIMIKDTIAKASIENGFNLFWESYGYKSGKQNAINVWKKLKPDPELISKICEAAKMENELRPHRIANGQTPIMAQGWLSQKRYEDQHPALIPLNRNQQQEVQREIVKREFITGGF